MSAPVIKQFKLTNDDEILAEVLQWDDEDNSAILIRGALRLIEAEDMNRGFRFWGFRPWMGFSEDPSTLQTLNAAHVIGETTPTDSLKNHYARTIVKIKKLLDENAKKVDIELDKMEHMNDDEIEEFLATHLDDNDSDFDNVVQFKRPDKLH